MGNNKKITIGLFNDSFFPGSDGVIYVVDNYARRLAEFANVVVFVPSYGKNAFDDSKLPYKVVRCNSVKMHIIDYMLPLPKLDMKFMKEVNKYKLDIVHIHSPFPVGVIGINYAKKHNVPVLATMHSQFKRDFLKFTHNEMMANVLNSRIIKEFDKCDKCVAVNKEVARIYYEDYHCKEMPGVINNATDLTPVPNVKEAHDMINKKHNIDPNDKVFLFVGRINTLKNILFTADALKRVKELNPDLHFKMLFVGSGSEEHLLIDRIKENGLEDDVILCGKVTNRYILSCYFSRADLFLFPSIYDASSLVQIEAASQKTPTIFLKGTATAATVTENVNGFMTENDVDAYANKIIEVMEDKKLYKKVSENAYKDLYRTWDDIVNEVFKLYLDLIDKNKKKKVDK